METHSLDFDKKYKLIRKIGEGGYGKGIKS